MSDSIIAIVPAAGVGARASRRAGRRAQQYRPLGGQPMLRLAVSALLADARIAQVRVAVTPGDGWVDDALTAATHRVARLRRRHACRYGGRRVGRQRAADDAWVLVHDAARPVCRPRRWRG